MSFFHLNQDRVPSSFTQQLASFPWIDSSQLNDSTQRMELGAVFFHERHKNAFMYVKADAALANGQLVGYALATTETVLSAGSSVAVQALSSAGLTVNAEIGNWLYVENGGSSPGPTILPIKANAASNITNSQRDLNNTGNVYDADALSAVLTNSTNAALIRNGHVIVGTATVVPVGVALATVTSGYFTLIQVSGVALVQAVGSGTAIVAGVPTVAGAAGVITGTPVQPGGTGATAAIPVNLYMGSANVIPLFAFTGAGPELIPCRVNFMGNL